MVPRYVPYVHHPRPLCLCNAHMLRVCVCHTHVVRANVCVTEAPVVGVPIHGNDRILRKTRGETVSESALARACAGESERERNE